MSTIIRDAQMVDWKDIKALYFNVADHFPDNLILMKHEITTKYIKTSLSLAINTGFAIVLEKDDKIIGYIQGYPSQNTRENHIIKDTRVIIHSDYNSSGYAIKLMNRVKEKMKNMKHIKSLLFNVRSHNTASARGLKFFGCYEIYEYQDALLSYQNDFMNDVVYKWDNPNFSKQAFDNNWKQILHHKMYADNLKHNTKLLTRTSNTGTYVPQNTLQSIC